jgi:hypothetical protein
MGNLVLTGATSGSTTLTPTDAVTTTLTLPSTSGTLAVSGGSPSFTTITTTNDASISGLTVGKGGGTVTGNTALGVSALSTNTTSDSNTAIGYQAGQVSNGTYGGNSFVGYQSGKASTTAYGCSFFGESSGLSNTTGVSNTAIGGSALRANTTASYNTATGYQALYANTTAQANTAFGYQAAYANTTGAGITAIGASALNGNTTGNGNVGIGGQYIGVANAALATNTTGSFNVGVGVGALTNNTTASNNTAVGYQAGYSTSTGGGNTFIGYQAGYSSAYSGSNSVNNVAIGNNSGYALTSGFANTLVGANAGTQITTGNKNSILGGYNGNQGGLDIRTQSNWIVLSDGDGNPRGSFDASGHFLVNRTSTLNNGIIEAYALASQQAIVAQVQSNGNSLFQGFNAAGTVQFQVTGNAGVYIASLGTGLVYSNGGTLTSTNPSDSRLKTNISDISWGLKEINQLRPVSYYLKTDTIGQGTQYGFIAQEVQEVMPELIKTFKGEDEVDYLGLDKEGIYATLVKAIQELNAKLEAQALEIATLKAK